MTRMLPRTISKMTDTELMTVVGIGTSGIRIVLTEKAIKRIPETIEMYKLIIDTGDGLLKVLEPKTDEEILIAKQFYETAHDMRESLKHIK